MRQRRWSSHWVVAVIHCWIGLAVQTNAVMMQAEPRWICAVAPLSLSGFSGAERDPPQELVPVLQCARALRFLADTEHKGDYRRIFKPKDLAAKGCSWNVFRCWHRSSLGKENLPRSKTCSGSSLAGSAGLPRCLPWVQLAPSAQRTSSRNLPHCAWTSLLLQPHHCSESLNPQGKAQGSWGVGGPSLGSLFPLLLPLPVAQTSPPPSWGVYLPSCFLGVGFLG